MVRRSAQRPRGCSGSTDAAIFSTVPWKGPVPLRGIDLGRITDSDLRKIARRDLRQNPDLGQIGDGERGRRAGLEQLSGRDLLIDDDSRDRRADDSGQTRRRTSRHGSGDRASIDAHRDQRLQRGVAIGFGARRIGLRLRRLALAKCRCARPDRGRRSRAVARSRRSLRPCDRCRSRSAKSADATSASGWPLVTGCPAPRKSASPGR